MKILNPFVHGIIDYVVVVFLLVSPVIFGLSGIAATATYILAIIHLLLTICTSFPLGLVKIIPFRIHGIIELLVSIILIFTPWILGFADEPTNRTFFIAFGIAVFLTWLITNYHSTAKKI